MILHPNLSVIKNCVIPDSCRVYQFVNLYDTTLGENCLVGTFVELGGVKIGSRTKISSHSYACPGVEIGDDCFIAHSVMFVNDKFSDVPAYATIEELAKLWTLRHTKVGNRVRIGSGVVIMPVHIGDDVIIGAGAVVTKDVPSGTTICGVPARHLRRHLEGEQLIDPDIW